MTEGSLDNLCRTQKVKRVHRLININYWKWYVQDSLGLCQIQKIKRADLINLYKKLQAREAKLISWGTVRRVNNMANNVLEKARVEDIIQLIKCWMMFVK